MRLSLIFSFWASVFCLTNCSAIYSGNSVRNCQDDVSFELKNAYDSLVKFPDNLDYQKRYFLMFPNNFEQFNNLFGVSVEEPFDSSRKYGIFYSEANSYIDCFFNLNSISKELLYRKIINICNNGRWYADVFSYFQFRLKGEMKLNVPLFVKLLGTTSKENSYGFWKFYFDCLHPDLQLPDYLLSVKEQNSEIYKIMYNAFTDVNKKWILFWDNESKRR